MNKITLLALGLLSVNAASYDYRDNGETWGDISDDCKIEVSNQSPIDLVSPKEVMRLQSYPIIGSEVDKIMKDYNNVKGMEIGWNGHTSQMDISNSGVYNRFQKRITGQYNTPSYYDGPMEFNALQFHFHSGSEHTVDGYRYDLEMHTVHQAKDGAKDGINYAAVGIMFDVNYYTAKLSWAEQKVIDNFFDSLSWENLTENPQVDIQNYGVLMTMVDFNNRYTYRGSVTTPPCARFVHWNVLSTVYPISQKHLDLFKGQLTRNTKQQPLLSVTGNYRVTQPINGHNVMYIKSETPDQASQVFAQDVSGELYLLEGAEDQKWLDEQEAAKYTLEETKPGQYHYVAKDEGTPQNQPASLPTLNLPTFSLSAVSKLVATFAISASIVISSV